MAYASGLFEPLQAAYPRSVWPALGSFETIPGQPRPLHQVPALAQLNTRGQDLFKDSGSHALLVLHGGRLVLENYADGYGPQTRFNSYSLIKSVVGALVLRAVSEGKISNLDDPVGTYLSGFGTEDFRNRPVGSFLEMRSGLDFEADGADKQDRLTTYNPFGKLAQLHAGSISAVEDQLKVSPEKMDLFVYQNVNTAVLGHVLETVYGRPLHQLVTERIWLPAGAGEAHWLRHGKDGPVTAYCCLYATPKDWLRVGRYLMTNGTPERPFLPQNLWGDYFGAGLSGKGRSDGTYGSHIRHNVLDRPGEALQGPFSYMMGQGGQIVYIMPGEDLVVVRFGERHSLLHSTLYSAWNSLAGKN
ncbi:serine hydrolase domain-containing protein [Roseibium sp. Sym1]|uniref:serine hydrolase domain-containing protein n=1 Tax=Roseibium sp. Sym1 TaxID=3016006 RepID=UPI0022B332F6|nr:serine hydrolase [Roseibium sp. Sym1]